MHSEKHLGLSILHDMGLPTPQTEVLRCLPSAYPNYLTDKQNDANCIILRPSLHIDYTADQVEAYSGYIDSLICTEHTWEQQRSVAQMLYQDVTILMQPYYSQAYGGVIHLVTEDGLARVVLGASSGAIVGGGNPLDMALISFHDNMLIYAHSYIGYTMEVVWRQMKAFWPKLSMLEPGAYELEFCVTLGGNFLFLQLQPSSVSIEQFWEE